MAVYGGYFQFHHSGHALCRHLFAAHMRFEEWRQSALEAMWHRLLFALDNGVLLVPLHIRFRDHSAELDKCKYCRALIAWYTNWLSELRSDHSAGSSTLLSAPQCCSARWPNSRKRRLKHDAACCTTQWTDLHLPSLRRMPCSHLSTSASSPSSSSFSQPSSVPLCLLVVSDDVHVTALFRAADEALLSSGDVVRFLPVSCGRRVAGLVADDAHRPAGHHPLLLFLHRCPLHPAHGLRGRLGPLPVSERRRGGVRAVE